MRKYGFEELKFNKNGQSTIADGRYGSKIEMSLFNPLVPMYYKNKALDMLNDFIEMHPQISLHSIDLTGGSLIAHIDDSVEISKNMSLHFFCGITRKKT